MSKPKFKDNTWDLFYELVRTDFTMRYHNSLLGFIWVLLKPLSTFLIIFAVFSWIFKSNDPYYALNLLLGILLYSYFSEATLRSVTCLQEKSSIILKVNFPKIIALITSITNSFISFLSGFLVFIVFWLFIQPPASLINLPYFILLVLILSGLILGLSFFLSIIYIKLKDLLSIWEIILKLIFYAAPIIYPLSIMPEKIKQLLFLNPLAIIIVESRSALITNQAFVWSRTLYILIITILLLIIGFGYFQKNVKQVAENF